MSETTNSADFPIGVSVSITQTCGKPASEFEMLTYAWYALGAKMRAAEGCTGRKMGSARVAFAMMAVCMALLVSELGLALGLLTFAWSAASGYLLGKFWVVPIVEAKRLARLRASGGEGV